MNESNKQFIAELHKRTNKYKELTQKSNNLYELGEEIKRTKQNMFVLIKTVLSTGTSSLIRTPVVFKDEKDYNNIQVYEYITMNQNGMGTIRERADQRKSWGTVMSRPMQKDELYKVLSDDKMCNEIILALTTQNSVKMLRTFKDIDNIREELKLLEQKYNEIEKNIEIEIEPQSVALPMIQTDTDSYNTKNVNIEITKIYINRHNAIEYEIKNCEDFYRASFGDMNTPLLFMQFQEELSEVLDKQKEKMENNKKMIDEHIINIENKLSTYTVMKMLK